MIPQEVFLSHATPDHEFASRIAELMRGHGLPVWYSRTNLLGAQQWQDEIGAALERCDWFAVVISPAAIESMWVRRELAYALAQRKFENRIVPVIHQTCEYHRLSWVLPTCQVVDFRSSFEDGARELLRVWGIGMKVDPSTTLPESGEG